MVDDDIRWTTWTILDDETRAQKLARYRELQAKSVASQQECARLQRELQAAHKAAQEDDMEMLVLKDCLREDEMARRARRNYEASNPSATYDFDENGWLTRSAMQLALSRVKVGGAPPTPKRPDGNYQAEVFGPLGEHVSGDLMAQRAIALHIQRGGPVRAIKAAGIPVR